MYKNLKHGDRSTRGSPKKKYKLKWIFSLSSSKPLPEEKAEFISESWIIPLFDRTLVKGDCEREDKTAMNWN